ncbi:MAG: hypothetical protein RL160_1677, partial [Bacteroidota bacterium]
MKHSFSKLPNIGAILLGLNAGLLVLSAAWWPLRMLYADSAFMGWRLFQHGQLEFGHLRFSSLVTQFLPWVAVHTGMELSTVLSLYSFGLQLPVFVLAWYAFKNKLHGTALACLLLCTAWTSSAWFTPASEMYLAAVFALSWHAIITTSGKAATSAILFFLAAITHSGILPALILLAFVHALHKPTIKWMPTALALLLVVVLKVLITDTYEHSFLANLLKPTLLARSYLPAYLGRTITQGSGAAILVLGSLALLVLAGTPRLLLWHGLLSIGLLLLFGLIFWEGDNDQVMEKNLIPFSMFLSHPLIQAFNEPLHARMRAVVLPLLLLFSAWQTQQGQGWALNRFKELRKLSTYTQKSCPSGKLAVSGNTETFDMKLHACWALPYETLMYS